MQIEEIRRLAKKMSRNNPEIRVLRKEYMENYSPLMVLIDDQFKQCTKEKCLVLPELRNDGNQTIAVYSDYSGESKDSNFMTYSFVACGWNHSFAMPEEMKNIREKHGLDNKELSFKDLRHGPSQRALKEYLYAANFLVFGLLFTVVIEKEVDFLFLSKDQDKNEISRILKEENFGEWKPKQAEKLLRIVHIVSYLMSLLSKHGQKLFWMTDNDEIAPNQAQFSNTLDLLVSVLNLYSSKKFDMVGGARPFVEKNVDTLDFLSLCDLSAGAISQYLNNQLVQDEVMVKKGADEILQWLAKDGVGLKKQTILIQKKDDGFVRKRIKFMLKDSPNKSNVVWV